MAGSNKAAVGGARVDIVSPDGWCRESVCVRVRERECGLERESVCVCVCCACACAYVCV